MKRLTLLIAALLLLTPGSLFQTVGSPNGELGKPDGPLPARVDCFGDSLPAGVLARMGSVRLDGEDSIRSAVFAPDGKSLSVLTEAREKQLWFFDVSTGRTLRRLSVPKGSLEHALTPDNRFLAVRIFYQVSDDPARPGVRNIEEIHVLEGTTGKLKWKTAAEHHFSSMALSPDGKLLAGGSTNKAGESNDLFLWDTATGKELAVLKGHLTPVTALAFSADGKRLLSGSQDFTPIAESKVIKGSVRVWQLPDGKLVKQPSAAGLAYVFSPNGRTLAFFDSEQKKVRLWDLEADREIAALPVATRNYLFAPDGRTFVTGSATEMLRLWDSATGREIRPFKGIVGNGTRPLAFSPDGKRIVSCSHYWSHDNSVRLWDVANGTELRPFGGHNLDISCLAFSADGKMLISGGEDQTARIWETASGKELVLHNKHQASVTAVAFSAEGRTVASGDSANITHIWDATTGNLLHRLPSDLEAPRGTKPAIGILSFSSDGKSLWVGSRVFSFNGRRLSGEKGELALYDTATGKRIRSIRTEDSFPMVVSPNGALSVWTGRVPPKNETDRLLDRWEEKVVVRRLDTGRELFQIAIGGDTFRTDEVVQQVIFSPDSRLIAINSIWHAESFTRSERVPCYRLVEVASGRDIVNKSGTDFPWTLFPPDGRVLAGSHQIERILAPVGGMIRKDRSSIRVVDPITQRMVGELPGHPLTTNPWAIAQGGQFFASANTNHTILVWDLTQQGLKKPPRRKDATRDQLEKLWTDLSGEDAQKAFRAAGDLLAVPAQSVPFLCKELKPVTGPPLRNIANHIKELDNDKREAREKARAALEEMGELAEPLLRQVLEKKPSLELRRRVEQVLEKLDRARFSPERVRAARAVAVLEQTGTTEARKHLTLLAAGAPGALLTREARSSLERLAQRSTGSPK